MSIPSGGVALAASVIVDLGAPPPPLWDHVQSTVTPTSAPVSSGSGGLTASVNDNPIVQQYPAQFVVQNHQFDAADIEARHGKGTFVTNVITMTLHFVIAPSLAVL